MLVYLNEFRRDEAGETVRHGDEVTDTDAEEYFGSDEPEIEEWERIDHDGETILKRASSHDGITAIAMPEKRSDEDDPNLPGKTIQLRKPGEETYFVQQAEIVEAIDDNP